MSILHGYTAIQILYKLIAVRMQTASTCSRWFLAIGFFFSEDGGEKFLRNVGSHKIYKAPHPRRRYSSS
jgi:predicted RNA binding protein YcfA (HicA-like mRNA interferase family)